MRHDLSPSDLTWSDVDPARHPFDPAGAVGVVAGIAETHPVPVRPTTTRDLRTVCTWASSEGGRWADALTQALVDRYGPWALGWRWAQDEGDIGGGPVRSWCCPTHSLTTPDATLAAVAAGLGEWRAWLEDLAELFGRFPLDTVPAAERHAMWQRATVHLVDRVVDATGAGDAWYAHCEQVLGWFLTRWGVAPQAAQTLAAEAIDGRFHSWIAPDTDVVAAVAEQLATHAADA